MRLVFNELYLFSTQEKEACKIKFDDGINVITSSQIDGTDRGKSVIMRSLYHALGADALFDDKWDAKNKVYILKFTINSTPYFIYRTADLFKMFDGNKMLLFSTISRHDLSSQLFPYTNFAVQLPSRNNQKLEITPPVFNYVLFFLDQDHYDGTKFTSFDRLGQYTNFKEYVLYYHLGAYDERYFELVRKKEQYVDEQNIAGKRAALLFEMQNDIEKKMGGSIFSGSIESLHAEMELCRTEYTNVLEKLNKSKEKILLLRNNQIESENAINELDLFSKQTEKELKILRGHRCPECNSFIQDTVSLQSKRYNLTEDVVSVRNMLQTALLEIANEIVKEEQKYTELLGEMRMYEERLKVNSGEIGDVLRLRGLGEIKDNLIIERQQLADTLAQINQALQDIKKKLRNYDDKKKSINEKYYSLLMSARTKFGLHDIKPDSFCSITKNFSAGGSNKPIATVMWYLTLVKLRKQFNPGAIEYPIVFDSPNNAETDDVKRHDLLQYILDESSNEGQLILSSIGFDIDMFTCTKQVNVITLENSKYHLLDSVSYEQYYPLLQELCDAE